MLALSTILGAVVLGQGGQNFDDVEVHAVPVQGNVYMLVGAGGNITVQVGDEGVLLVDTQFAELSDKILAAIRGLTDQPIRVIVNTHLHADHTGGNANLVAAGGSLDLAGRGGDTKVIAHENVLGRMSSGGVSPDSWPLETYFSERKDFFVNGEAIVLLHPEAAHTDGDTIVFFRRSDVVSTGDIFVTTSYPFIDQQNGGSIRGIIDGLNQILEIAVPTRHAEGGTVIIPGHGRLCHEHEVLEYRDMVVIIRDRIQDMVARGMTLDQVKAARPTLDYDARFGADTGFWTTAMFIEAVYRDVSAGPPAGALE